MKITKEKFNKLPQLDRIEYRQRDDRIRNYIRGSVLITLIYTFSFVIGFILLMYVGLLNISEEIATRFLLDLSSGLLPVMKYSLIIAFAVDVAFWVYKFNLLLELNK